MTLLKLASFTDGALGGNPAGVMISDALPPEGDMQAIAADLGYSETVFSTRDGDGFRTRYFAPEGEVPFCGHATIALGAALGAAYGAGTYKLILNAADISVEAYLDGDAWGAALLSPGTSHEGLDDAVIGDACALFGFDRSDLVPDMPPVLANAGANHLILPVARDALVTEMAYAFDAGAAFMQAHGFVTINLCHRLADDSWHCRNAFAGHGVYEDPATGAAAAALAGYLRDAGISDAGFSVSQGAEMGAPSRLEVVPLPERGAAIRVAGLTRLLD